MAVPSVKNVIAVDFGAVPTRMRKVPQAKWKAGFSMLKKIRLYRIFQQ